MLGCKVINKFLDGHKLPVIFFQLTKKRFVVPNEMTKRFD